MTLGSARLSFGSELSNSRICNSPFAPKMGKDVLPGFCSGRSATRKSSQVLSLYRKTPGLSRHSTFIPSMLGRMSDGLRMGFSAKRFAMSAIVRIFVHVTESRQGGIATSFRFTPPPFWQILPNHLQACENEDTFREPLRDRVCGITPRHKSPSCSFDLS